MSRQRAGDLHEAPIDMRQFGGEPVEGAPVPDEGEQSLRRRAVACPGAAPQAARREAERHVVGDRERAEQARRLVGARDASPGDDMRGPPGQVALAQPDRARTRAVEA